MSIEEKLKRINELYHLSQERQLTEDELSEQQALRKEYAKSVRDNLRGQLDNMDYIDKNGKVKSVASLKKKI